MKIILYRFNYKKTDVCKVINNSETYTCTLRFPTNILNPIVRIQLDKPTTTIKNWSYAYIEEFGKRYYFVENIVAFTNNLYDLYLHVDVLYTYIGVHNSLLKEQICLVKRSSNSTDYNKLLRDDKLTFEEKTFVKYYKINDDTSVPFVFGNLSSTSRNVLVTVICDVDLSNITGFDGSDNLVPYETYYPTYLNGVDIKSRATNYNCGSITYMLTAEQARALAKVCLNSASTRSYVKSFIVFPYDLTQMNGGVNYSIIDKNGKITFGVQGDYHIAQTPSGYEQNVYLCKRAMISSRIYTTNIQNIKSNLNSGNNFYDYGPYSKYEIYIPYVGYVDIDWNIICNCANSDIFKIQLTTDLETGDTSYDIIINGIPYKSQKLKIGLNVNLSSTNLYENERMKYAINSQEVASSVVSGLAIIGGALVTIFSSGIGAGAGVSMMLGGIGGYASGIISGEGNRAKLIDYGYSGTSSSSEGLLSLQQIIWRVTRLTPSYDRTNSYICDEIGVPCMKPIALKNCRYYNEFGKCEFSLPNVKEEEELEDLMMKGVHFPSNAW